MKTMKNKNWLGLAVTMCLVAGCSGAIGSSIEIPSTPDGTILAVSKSLSEGQPQVLWSALPASYQKDVKGLIYDLAGKLDKEVYDKSVAVLSKAARLLREKKDFILGLPHMQQGPGAQQKEAYAKNWDSMVGMLDTLVQSEIKTVEGLKTVDPERFLAVTGAKLFQQGQAAMASLPKPPNAEMALGKLKQMKDVKTTVIKTEGDSAIIKVESPGEKPNEVKLTRVEGKWVPEDMARDWSKNMAEAKKEIAGMDMSKSKVQVMGILGMADSTIDQLLAAKSQEEFTQAVTGLAMMFGGPAAMPGRPQPGAPYGGPRQ